MLPEDCLSLSLQLHIGPILCCTVLPTKPHDLVYDKEKCLQNPDRCFLWFSYGPMNPDACNCLTVVITTSVRKHCSMYLKQYSAGILQNSNLSSFNWAVLKQWEAVNDCAGGAGSFACRGCSGCSTLPQPRGSEEGAADKLLESVLFVNILYLQ